MKTLKNSPQESIDPNGIEYVAKLLRKKIKDNAENQVPFSTTEDHNILVQKNVWSYAKKFIKKPSEILPTFSKNDCIEYFKKTFNVINPRKLFRVPDHIPKFDQPSIEFDLTEPTYQEVTRIIRRMKTLGSPCPLDQISIISLQRMPYLRTYIHRILVEVWKAGSVPSTWKRAVTVLIHKKGDPNVPANFRPITLKSVPLKVFTSLIRNRMFDFLLKNRYLEHNIQKGFIPKISGT